MPKIKDKTVTVEELQKRVELLEKCAVEHTKVLKNTRKVIDNILELERYNIDSADKLIREHRILSALVILFNILVFILILLYKFNIL